METITEIRKIELELLSKPEGAYSVKINGGGEGTYEYKVPAKNYRQWARVFTRLAMEMWANVDAKISKKEED